MASPYKLLQKHGKHLMAVFSVFLMIAFTLPSAMKRATGSAPAIASFSNGDKVHLDEYTDAKKCWEMINTVSNGRNTPLGVAALGPAAAEYLTKHPMEFLLLQKEAQQMGVSVNADELETNFKNIQGLKTGDPDHDDFMRHALAQVMLVRGAFERAANTVKISEPMVKLDLAQVGQTITVNTVEFSAGQYTAKVPAPTADQLKAQFEKYADNLKGVVTSSNPHGFGYRYPDRIKLQYIVVPQSDVRKMVEASKDDYAWRVDAQKYYIQNPGKFVSYSTTEPADSTGFSMGGSKKGTPTTKPFDQVQAQIKSDLIDAETARRMSAIMERINSTLAADYVGYTNALANAAGATTTATTGPSASTQPTVGVPSSLKVPYNSFEYLQKLAAAVQAEFKVLPTVVSVADKWQTTEDISKLPGIGQLQLDNYPFAEYVTQMVAPFVPAEMRNKSEVLKIYAPSKIMTDASKSNYIARISDAEPSHKPDTLTEVEAQVKADVISAGAYGLAKADAEKLLADARQKGLLAAAGTAHTVLPVGPLNSTGQQTTITVLNLTGPSVNDFLRGAFNLITTPTSRPSGEPVALIEIPRDGRAIVTELLKVQAGWTDRSFPFELAQARESLSGRMRQEFSRNWFDYDSVAARLKYTPDKDFKDSEAQLPPMQPMMPQGL